MIALLCTSSISASNSSEWTNISLNNIDFKIPNEYAGGRLSENGYSYENIFEFGLLCLDDSKNLINNYGYESTFEEVYDMEEATINGHHAVAYYSNRSIVEHNVTFIYFESNKTIYQLSYNGNKIDKTAKKIIDCTPKSQLTKSEFNEKLNTAQEDYIQKEYEEEQEYLLEEAYNSGYNEGYSHGSSSLNNFGKYYLIYKLGQHSR